jgi:hypothetical protein
MSLWQNKCLCPLIHWFFVHLFCFLYFLCLYNISYIFHKYIQYMSSLQQCHLAFRLTIVAFVLYDKNSEQVRVNRDVLP